MKYLKSFNENFLKQYTMEYAEDLQYDGELCEVINKYEEKGIFSTSYYLSLKFEDGHVIDSDTTRSYYHSVNKGDKIEYTH